MANRIAADTLYLHLHTPVHTLAAEAAADRIAIPGPPIGHSEKLAVGPSLAQSLNDFECDRREVNHAREPLPLRLGGRKDDPAILVIEVPRFRMANLLGASTGFPQEGKQVAKLLVGCSGEDMRPLLSAYDGFSA